jgi:cobalt-zinc-cadmium efflux system outer membrane protein
MTDRERWRFAACLAVATVVLAGCAATPPDHGFAELDSAVRQRTGMAVTWNHGAGAGAASSDVARSILSRPLKPEGAVRVALLRNRGLQASFADIGLAEADLAQAGLLQNPVLDTSLRFPDRLYGITDVAVALSENLLNLILLPARQQVAAGQAESVRFRVAAAVLDLVADVRTAYWRLRADQAVAVLLRDRVAASDAAASLAARLHQAGNISELDLAREQADAETTRAEYADALAAGASDREELNRLMGLFGNDATAWSVPDDVPAPPPDRLPYDRLEVMAIQGNLHIESLRLQAEASARALGIARDYGWLTDIEVGVSTEKNPEGYRVTGPTLRLALPLFDRGQARRLRAAAVLQQDEDRMAQLAIDTRSHVRAVRDRLVRDRDLADRYASVVVPLQRRILALGVRQYNFMLLGPFDLLRSKQDEIAASRRLIEARRDWWTQAAELGRLLGGAAEPVAPLSSSPPVLANPDIKENRP